jgi:16S rRNA (guanine(966)-N(2))-methyltransferase RsmD
MRVVGGTARGRKLAPFKTAAIRPTSDKAREAIFNVLNQNRGAAVLDIFAGTGALGIEALSRGAASVVFIDNSKGATGVIKKNLSLCGFVEQGRIINKDVLPALSYLKGKLKKFDLIFIDAPYAEALLTATTLKTLASGLLNKDSRIVCEVAKNNPIKDMAKGLTIIKEKTYGDTLIYFLKPSETVQAVSNDIKAN